MSFTSLLVDRVTIITLGPPVEGDISDVYGNPLEVSEAESEVPARVELLDATETDLNRQTRISRYKMFLPPDVAVDAIDQIIWEGRTHDVIGRPEVVEGLTGPHHIELMARLVEA